MRTFFLVLATVFAAACGSDSPTTPSAPLPRAEFSVTDLVIGTGAEALPGSTITANYSVWLYNPAGADGKGQPIRQGEFLTPSPLVPGSLIQGWLQGIPGMRVGGRRRLVIPPELAYGAGGAGNGEIPPNATLVFEMELLSVS